MSSMTNPFVKATKARVRAKVGIGGPAGSGKTFTGMILARELSPDGRFAVIDTEHGSASLYSETFDFDTLELGDFHPDRYIENIIAAKQAGYGALLIDSASHEWNGRGGCLELKDHAARKKYGGNDWAAWADVTPLHTRFIETLHTAGLHIIVTYRSKMEYMQVQEGDRTKIKKVGMAPITREGAEYELDIFGEMDVDHRMVITKTRCEALTDREFVKPGRDLADIIRTWLEAGAPQPARPARPGDGGTGRNGQQPEETPLAVGDELARLYASRAMQRRDPEYTPPQRQQALTAVNTELIKVWSFDGSGVKALLCALHLAATGEIVAEREIGARVEPRIIASLREIGSRAAADYGEIATWWRTRSRGTAPGQEEVAS